MPGLGLGLGHGVNFGIFGEAWSPTDLGSDLKLWLRPEELVNPNRLLHTEDIANSLSWAKNGTVAVSGGQTDPDGGSTAFLVSSESSFHALTTNAVGFQASGDEAASVWMKRGPSHDGVTQVRMGIRDGSTLDFVYQDVPPATWTRVSGTDALGAGATASQFYLYPIDRGTSADHAVLLWHPQLESGTSATDYVANAATAGGLVASWADQSGLGNDATQGTQASMPLVQAGVLDGYAGALFDGVDDDLDVTLSAAATQPSEVWGVVQLDSGYTDNDGGSFVSGNLSLPVQHGILTSAADSFGVRAGAWVNDSSAVDVSPHLLSGVYNGASSLLYKDGTQVGSGDSGSRDLSTDIYIGSTVGTGGYVAAHILEVVLVDAALSADDRASMLAYLNNKYPTLGIAVPSGPTAGRVTVGGDSRITVGGDTRVPV